MKDITDYIIYEIENNTSPQPVVTVFADLNYDYIYYSPALEAGKEVIIKSFKKTIAGAGGYVSCGLAKLGAEVYLLTILGDDEEGRSLYEEIERYGVKRDGIRLIEGKKSPFTLIFTTEKEETPRQVATFPGTSRELSVNSIDYEPYVERSNLVYSCNYFILTRLREGIKFVFRFAKKKGILTSYDANAGDGWGDESQLATLKKSIYPVTDIVFLNEDEAGALTGFDDPATSIRVLCPESTTVVIKLGPRGALVRHRERLYKTEAFPPQGNVLDTVGAGDAFQAAFLYFYLRRFPIELCAILGAANASSTVRYTGGTEGQLDCAGLCSYIKKYRTIDRGDGTFSVERRRAIF